jgi:hypothetical protein
VRVVGDGYGGPCTGKWLVEGLRTGEGVDAQEHGLDDAEDNGWYRWERGASHFGGMC